MPPRIVRRRPLIERIKSALDPWDLFLWVSEEIETRDLSSKSLGTQLGISLNFIFLIARANAAHSTDVDDVFSDAAGSGWLSYLVSTEHMQKSQQFLMAFADSSLPRPGQLPGPWPLSQPGTSFTRSGGHARTDSSKPMSNSPPSRRRPSECVSSLRLPPRRPCGS